MFGGKGGAPGGPIMPGGGIPPGPGGIGGRPAGHQKSDWEGRKVNKTYHRMEEVRRTQEEARRNPWEDHRMADQKELDAGDQTQTHQEEDYRSRMQL